ncbi:MAG: PIG-L family deacetylase [bacterium]|nr:PIG-L family deacetylase [bacterium]
MSKKSKGKRVVQVIVIAAIAIVLTAFWFMVRKPYVPPPVPLNLPVTGFSQDDRILILAPHPDDEVLGCGGVIQTALSMNIPVHVVFLTYGDANEWSFMVYRDLPVLTAAGAKAMGMVRHDEAVAADTSLGLNQNDLTFLGFPDAGTLQIFTSHWLLESPYRSILTKAEVVPYQDAYRPGTPYKGEEILADLENIIRDFHPTKIFVSHPADTHPDHQAFYLFTRVALWELGLDPEPEIITYLVHSSRWPVPHGYYPAYPLSPPDVEFGPATWSMLSLDQAAISNKFSAIQLHRTQYEGNRHYLVSFIRTNELFMNFPDLSLAPAAPAANVHDLPTDSGGNVPDQFAPVESSRSVGIEQRSMQLVADGILFHFRFSHPIGSNVWVSVYALGYKNGTPFSNMPKIHVRFGASSQSVFNQGTELPIDSIEVSRDGRDITLKIPLQLLGNPDMVCTGAESYFGDIPLDRKSWRVLDITN